MLLIYMRLRLLFGSAPPLLHEFSVPPPGWRSPEGVKELFLLPPCFPLAKVRAGRAELCYTPCKVESHVPLERRSDSGNYSPNRQYNAPGESDLVWQPGPWRCAPHERL